jgi:hypothetical protein
MQSKLVISRFESMFEVELWLRWSRPKAEAFRPLKSSVAMGYPQDLLEKMILGDISVAMKIESYAEPTLHCSKLIVMIAP